VELILITIFEKTKRETKKMEPFRFKTRLESSLLKLKASSNLRARVEARGSAKRFYNQLCHTSKQSFVYKQHPSKRNS
jgi:hypothetical protein